MKVWLIKFTFHFILMTEATTNIFMLDHTYS